MSVEYITASDTATLRERIVERRAESIRGVIDLLVERADTLPKVLYGDYVSHKERNLLVDVFKLSTSLYPLYFPVEEYLKYVNQMRFVTKGDVIEPSDHNLAKYALKALVDAVKKQLAEGLVLPDFSEEQIGIITEKIEDKVWDVELKTILIREVDYGDFVLSMDYNYTVEAVREALKILWYIIPFEIERLVEIILSYECTLVSYDILSQILATYECTLYALDVITQILPSVSYTLASFDISADVPLSVHVTTVAMDAPTDILAPVSITLYSLDALIELLPELQVTLYSLSLELITSLICDFPPHITISSPILAVGELIPVVSGYGFLSLTCDFPPLVQGMAWTLMSCDFPPIVSALGEVLALYDFPPIVSALVDASTFYDFPPIVSAFMEILISHDFPPLLSSDVPMSAVCEIVPKYIPAKITYTEILSATEETLHTLDAPVTACYVSAYSSLESLDLLTACYVSAYSSLESLDLLSVTNLNMYETLYALDLVPEVVAELNMTLRSADIDAEGIASIEETLYALDIIAACYATVHTFLESLDLLPAINLNISTTLYALDLVPEVVAELNITLYSTDVDAESVATIEETLHALDASLLPSCFYDVTLYAPAITAEPEVSYEHKLHYWLSPEWRYRRRITIHNWTQEVSDYAVMIVLTPENFDYGKAREDGADIRITKEDGETILPYWIERWCYGGKSIIWVKVDNLPLGATDLWLYYGNPAATSEERPHEVFAEFLSPSDVLERIRCDVYVGGGAKPARVE